MSDTQPHQRYYTPKDRDVVPTVMVRVLFGIVMLCLILVSAHVWTGQPREAVPPVSPVVAERTIYLAGDISGAATVTDADGTVIADLSPEEGGFVSGVYRVIAHERKKARVAPDGPVVVAAFENGRMAVTDPSTGWSADLMGFGQDNAAAFAKLLLDPARAAD